jgi:excisionase family DNA binding protein
MWGRILSYSTVLSINPSSRGGAHTREDILTTTGIAEYLEVTERTLYRRAQEGKIPAFKAGVACRDDTGEET